MTSIQPYQGLKDGFSVPWKKSKPENFKNPMDLLVADGEAFEITGAVYIFHWCGSDAFINVVALIVCHVKRDLMDVHDTEKKLISSFTHAFKPSF